MQTTLTEETTTPSTTSTTLKRTSDTTSSIRRHRSTGTSISQRCSLSSSSSLSCIGLTKTDHDCQYNKHAQQTNHEKNEEQVPDLQVAQSSKSSLSSSSSSSSLSSLVDDDVDIDVDIDDDDASKQQQQQQQEQKYLLHPTYTLPLLVMIDMLAVSLVIPLLMNYYGNAGVTNAKQREWLSSLFSFSQIVGGLVLGGLADSGIIQDRRSILIISFAGSAISYLLLVQSKNNSIMLVTSRILVGLVKQTMTVCTTLLAQYTTTSTDIPATTKDNHHSHPSNNSKHTNHNNNDNTNNRAVHMGRLKASVTFAWIVGPTMGGLLYKHVHVQAPGIMAATLFGINIILTILFLPPSISKKSRFATCKNRASRKSLKNQPKSLASTTTNKNRNDSTKQATTKFALLVSNLKTCFASPALRSAIVSFLLYTWVLQATDRTNTTTAMGNSYYFNMYGLESHHRGYLSSYQSIVSLGIHSFVMGPWVKYVGSGDERYAATYAAIFLSFILLLERQGHLYTYLFLILPITSLSLAVMGTCLNTLITHVVTPKDSLGSVLAALDVIKNIVTVTVPFYRTFLFTMLLPSQSPWFGTSTTSYKNEHDNTTTTSITRILQQVTPSKNGGDQNHHDDPDPQTWILLASLHWFVAALALGILLLGPKSFSSSKQQLQREQSTLPNDANYIQQHESRKNNLEKKTV